MNVFTEIQRETPAEKAKRIGVPVVAPLPIGKNPQSPNPIMAICGKCGIELHRVMGYVCQHGDCPTGLASIGYT